MRHRAASAAPRRRSRAARDADAGRAGLPAGTYTLLLFHHALPGAFRVEINGGAARAVGQDRAIAMRNGFWSAPGALSVPDAGVADALPRQLIPDAGWTRCASCRSNNETSYGSARRCAASGVPRASLPQDGRNLSPLFTPGAGEQALRFRGEVDFRAAEGGFAGSVAVLDRGGQPYRSAGAGRRRHAWPRRGVAAGGDLNALSAALALGARPEVSYGQSGNSSSSSAAIATARAASRCAPRAAVGRRSADGGRFPVRPGHHDRGGRGHQHAGRARRRSIRATACVYQPGYMDESNSGSMLAVSNGWLAVLPMAAARGPQPILVGVAARPAARGPSSTPKGRWPSPPTSASNSITA